MRTTVDLSPDAYYVAKAYAQENKISLGKALSRLVTRPESRGESKIKMDRGFPCVTGKRVLTPELVREIIDED